MKTIRKVSLLTIFYSNPKLSGECYLLNFEYELIKLHFHPPGSHKHQILHTELTGYWYGYFAWDAHVQGGFSHSFVTCKSWFCLVAEIWQKNQRTVPGTHGCNINTNSIKTKHATSQSSEVAIFIYGAKKYWVNVCTGYICKNYRIYPCTSRSCV